MNEYFGPKHKIEVPYMHHSKVRVESFAVYNERTQQVNTGENKTIISKQKRKWVSVQYEPTSRGENGQGSSSVNQLPLTWTYSPAEFLLESSRHEISHTRISLTFK